jgi:UDP-galactopyranose mutase
MKMQLPYPDIRAVTQAVSQADADANLEHTPKPYLVVFSHLRWGFVYQRPQHLLSRLARHYRVLFIEEPVFAETPARLEAVEVADDVEVLTLQTPIDSAGFDEEQLRILQPLVAKVIAERGIEDYVVWFYTPMALPLLSQLAPRAVVYDCMDDIGASLRAPSQMRQLEAELLQAADLILTSGPALYEAKRVAHRNVNCLPSAVDAAHFAPASLQPMSLEAQDVERLQGHIPRPRLGFFGVVDKRVDLALLAALADADPHWQIVMVGPVLEVDPGTLPRRPNIHWLGMQPYSRLPQLVAGWDICLMPFVLDRSTRFISPTKTLEYMAAEKPVVSTAVPDVVSLYGDVVRIASTRSGFVEQCREALGENSRRRAQRVMEMTQCVARFSWDLSAATVHELIQSQLDAKLVGPLPGGVSVPRRLEIRHGTGPMAKPGSAIPRAVAAPDRAVSSVAAHALRVASMMAADRVDDKRAA